MYTATIYDVLVSYERMFVETKDGKSSLGFETIQESIPVEAYNADDARTLAFNKMCDKLSVEIVRVRELPQDMYMKIIGAPQLFALAA